MRFHNLLNETFPLYNASRSQYSSPDIKLFMSNPGKIFSERTDELIASTTDQTGFSSQCKVRACLVIHTSWLKAFTNQPCCLYAFCLVSLVTGNYHFTYSHSASVQRNRQIPGHNPGKQHVFLMGVLA